MTSRPGFWLCRSCLYPVGLPLYVHYPRCWHLTDIRWVEADKAAGHKSRKQSFMYRTADGRQVWMSVVRSAPAFVHGTGFGTRGIVYSVTKRKYSAYITCLSILSLSITAQTDFPALAVTQIFISGSCSTKFLSCQSLRCWPTW